MLHVRAGHTLRLPCGSEPKQIERPKELPPKELLLFLLTPKAQFPLALEESPGKL